MDLGECWIWQEFLVFFTAVLHCLKWRSYRCKWLQPLRIQPNPSQWDLKKKKKARKHGTVLSCWPSGVLWQFHPPATRGDQLAHWLLFSCPLAPICLIFFCIMVDCAVQLLHSKTFVWLKGEVCNIFEILGRNSDIQWLHYRDCAVLYCFWTVNDRREPLSAFHYMQEKYKFLPSYIPLRLNTWFWVFFFF